MRLKLSGMGGYSKENISGGTSARTGCLSETSEDCSGHSRLHQSSRPETLDWGARIRGAAMPTFRICKQWMRTNDNWKTKQRCMESRNTGFSGSSSSDRLTEEQENEIAENIYDWWISGKSYKQWYAEKFQQMKLDFGEEE